MTDRPRRIVPLAGLAAALLGAATGLTAVAPDHVSHGDWPASAAALARYAAPPSSAIISSAVRQRA